MPVLHIFRKVSLERLRSPEQLDQLMQVTSPKGWIALIAVISLLAVALIWGFLGSIPTTAGGEGILLRRGGVTAVISTGSGQVDEVLVGVGDRVEKGQVVARLRQEGIARQVADLEARKAAGLTELAELQSYADDQTRLSKANRTQRRSNLTRSIATFERQLELLRKNLEVQKELLADGLVTQNTVLASEQEVNRVNDQLASERLALSGLELSRLEGEQQLQQRLDAQRNEMREIELQLAEKKASFEESVQIIATDQGRVIELMVDRGDVVNPGSPVMNMELESEDLMAVVFVPAGLGKQVQPGMEVRVTPSTVKAEEHGFIVGEVQWVAEFPSTSRGMGRLLANDDLVNKLMQRGPPIQVDVKLLRDESTSTGFEWSSSKGPNIEISSGTLATGSIIVRESRPITLVIPGFKESLGL